MIWEKKNFLKMFFIIRFLILLILFYIIPFLVLSTFSATHVRTVRTGSYASEYYDKKW